MSTAEPPQKKERWHLDKGIPLSIIALLIAQAVAAVWWVGGLSNKVDATERRIAHIEAQRVSERLTALEAQMSDSRSSLLRIETKLDRLVENRR